MIKRQVQTEIMELLDEFPAVAVLGPRQVGKTTLAREIAASIPAEAVYLDLENPTDRVKLDEPEIYFSLHKGKLIILDEIQRVPELFQILRGVIDQRRSEGYRFGQFLILGSASLDLLKQSSESSLYAIRPASVSEDCFSRYREADPRMRNCPKRYPSLRL